MWARHLFAEVRVAVLYGAPGPRDALAGLKAREVILTPLFAFNVRRALRPRRPAARRAVLWHAAAVRATAAFGSVRVAFLDEPPYLEKALRRLQGLAVAVGLFDGEGQHAGRDVPSPLARYAQVPVHNLGAIGADPGIPQLVLGQVAAAERSLAAVPLAVKRVRAGHAKARYSPANRRDSAL